MPTKEERRELAKKHIALMKGAFETDTAKSVESATIYEDGEGRDLPLPEPASDSTQTKVTTKFTVSALYDAQGKVCVVDPVSFTRPGGNYEEGSFGPEQALCAESNLYQVLQGLKREYHDANRGYTRGQLFTDRALLLHDIAFSRNGEVRTADVIGVAEPNRKRALENHRSERECDHALSQRIETMLRIAAADGCDTLVMGAFACGRENYRPEQVAGLIKDWVEAHPGAIGTIVFAVPRSVLDVFQDAFGRPEEEAAPVAAPAKADDDADDDGVDLDNIDLPEGVTLRR